MRIRQKTIRVNDEKICIKSRPCTSVGNLVGYNVWINNEKFFCNRLTREECEDSVYAKWVKRHNVSEPNFFKRRIK